MDVFTVSFFGHRKITDFEEVSWELEKIVEEILCKKENVEFLVGKNGDFDYIASSIITRLRKKGKNRYNNCFVLVMPYETAEVAENYDDYLKYYDEIEICPFASSVHYKKAYEIRNKKMIERSDLIIFCVEREKGGAYQALKYAVENKKTFINLGKNSNEKMINAFIEKCL